MRIWPFRRSRAEEDAERLLAAVAAASRRPDFFGENRVPDTLEGRFELVTLNAALALIRLRAAPGAEPLAQAFADRLFRYLDAGLREAGVSDTAVPKRMHKLAGSFYGRLDAYSRAFADIAGLEGALEGALSRNVWRVESHPFAALLAAYAADAARRQAAAPVAALWDPAFWAGR
jgi:cytochrome b pre-mRNA-processing protein 3